MYSEVKIISNVFSFLIEGIWLLKYPEIAIILYVDHWLPAV